MNWTQKRCEFAYNMDAHSWICRTHPGDAQPDAVTEVVDAWMASHHLAHLTDEEYGARAFKQGLDCIPALDTAYMTMLRAEPLAEPFGDGFTVCVPLLRRLKAWHRGWAMANLAAPILTCDACGELRERDTPHQKPMAGYMQYFCSDACMQGFEQALEKS
jgi:hypothetical protein